MRVRFILNARRAVTTALAAGLIAVTMSGPASATETALTFDTARIARLNAALDALTIGAKKATPALSVAIVENNRVVYMHAAGFANVERNEPVAPGTRFNIASVSKMFTAVAVMQLVRAHKVSLDAKLAAYLPDAPHAEAVTIRQLLEHTSGISNYLDFALASGATGTPVTPQGIIKTVAGKPLDFVPGAKYSYSNTGYVLLGLVVEKVARIPLHEYMRRYIFAPAHLTATGFADAPADAGRAAGYTSGKPITAALDPTWLYADGDIVSTAFDLATFDIALMNGVLIDAASFEMMQSDRVTTAAGGLESYGLGLSLVPFGDKTLVGHHGGMPGFAAENETIPSERFAIVVLSNDSNFLTARVNNAVVAELYPATMQAAVAAAAAAAGKTTLVAAPGEDAALSASFAAIVKGLQNGRLDRSRLSKEMNDALSPADVSAIATELKGFGPLQRLVFKGSERSGPYRVFHYQCVFARDTQPLSFVLDAADKLAGLAKR